MKNAYCRSLQLAVERERERSREVSRQFTLDAVTLALAELGFTDFEKFRTTFENVEYEIAKQVTSESAEERANGDKIQNIWLSKEYVDRALKAAVGDLFVPWEERYGC